MRGVRVAASAAITAIVLTVPAASTAGASSGVAARSPRCTQGVTFRIVSPIVARTRVVNVRSANIRRLPGVDCPQITSVRRGTRLAATGRVALVGRSRWVEVRGSFGTGWVAFSLLR